MKLTFLVSILLTPLACLGVGAFFLAFFFLNSNLFTSISNRLISYLCVFFLSNNWKTPKQNNEIVFLTFVFYAYNIAIIEIFMNTILIDFFYQTSIRYFFTILYIVFILLLQTDTMEET